MCPRCRDSMHVIVGDRYHRCPECYSRKVVRQSLEALGLPPTWENLSPATTIPMFGEDSPTGKAVRELLAGHMSLVHAYGLPSVRRAAFIGTLAYGFLEQGKGIQVLDTADLAAKHFAKEDKEWASVRSKRVPVILTFGREVEARLGMFYLRELLDRAHGYSLPFVLVTDHPLNIHTPRYPDLADIIRSTKLDAENIALSEDA